MAVSQRRLPQHQNHLFCFHRFQLDRFGPDPFGVGAAAGVSLDAPLGPVAEVLERAEIVNDFLRNAACQGENAAGLLQPFGKGKQRRSIQIDKLLSDAHGVMAVAPAAIGQLPPGGGGAMEGILPLSLQGLHRE